MCVRITDLTAPYLIPQIQSMTNLTGTVQTSWQQQKV